MKGCEQGSKSIDELVFYDKGPISFQEKEIPGQVLTRILAAAASCSVEACSIIGNVDYCIERLGEYKKAGLTSAVLSFQGWFDSTITHLSKLVSHYSLAEQAP